jgi:hypothetical protein
MSNIVKAIKFVNGVAQQISPSTDSLAAASYFVGGTGGTELTQTILNNLTGGTSTDASSLHNHDTRYYTKAQHLSSSAGAASANQPIQTNASGYVDPTFITQGGITHANLAGLTSSDDHTQYHNNTRGDARYFQQSQFLAVSAGAGSAGAPVKLNSSGQIDATMISSSATNHESLSGLLGGTTAQHYHLTQSEHDTLQGAGGVVDASSLHSHSSLYYTKSAVDTSLAAKAPAATSIQSTGSIAFTADQSMGSHKLTNVADPSVATDAATKNYTDTQTGLLLPKAGGTMSGTLNMGSQSITNVATPVSPNDAANKAYVDAAQAGLLIKAPVYAVATTNISLSGATPTIDGVTVPNGSRVLAVGQTTASQNGVYIVGSGSWAADGDWVTGQVVEGNYYFVDYGTSWARSAWVVSTQTAITVGTSSVAFQRYNAAGQLVGGVGITITGDTVAVNFGAGTAQLPTGEIGIGLYASSGLDLVDSGTGLPSTAQGAQLTHKLDGTTLSKSSTGVKVAAGGITATELNSSVAGSGLSGGAGSSLSVNTGHGTQIYSGAVVAKASDLAGTGLQATGSAGSDTLQINPSIAGNGLAYSAGVASVKTDGTTVDLNGSQQIEVKAGGVGTAQLASNAVDNTKILFTVSGNGVRASNIPLLDTLGTFSSNDVESALNQMAKSTFVENYTAGEAIGSGALVCIRRDSGNLPKLYKASAAASDNYLAGTLLLQDITYTSVTPSGNFITVTYVNPGAASSALSVSVTGNAITVYLATNSSSSLISTATQVALAVNTSTPASALVTATVTGTGSNIQAAASAASLTGGMDFNDNGRWEVVGMTLSAVSSGSTVNVQKIGRLACSFVSAPTAANIGQAVYLSINQGQAVVYTAPSVSNQPVVELGRLVSTTEVEFRAPQLRYIN